MLWPMRRLAALLAALIASAAHAQYGERIDVVRILLDVRVTNMNGEPLADLTPADFNVRIGGKRAEVESVEWIDETFAVSIDDPQEERVVEVRRGRLFVVFVQTDFARNNVR